MDRQTEREREKEERKTLNPCKKEERVSSLSSTLIPEINDFMLSLRRVIIGVLVSLPLFPPRVSAGHFDPAALLLMREEKKSAIRTYTIRAPL